MKSGQVSRRSAMVGAAAVGGVVGLSGSPAHALVSAIASAPTSDLSREIEALRQATVLAKCLAKQRMSFCDDYPPDYATACDHAGMLMDNLLLSPARCGADVIAKYGLMEESCIRET